VFGVMRAMLNIVKVAAFYLEKAARFWTQRIISLRVAV